MHGRFSRLRVKRPGLPPVVVLTFGVAVAAVLACAISSAAHTGNDDPAAVELDEKLGERVPMDLSFVDDQGRTMTLGEAGGGKPILLSLAYFRCTTVCPLYLAGLAQALDRLPAEPGKDFVSVTVSFDERDTPETAREKKRNYLSIFKDGIPPEAWAFLTGTDEAIHRLTDAVGYSFMKKGDEFLHPVTLIVLAPDGTIVRYLNGKRFLPFDIRMALTEASEGRVGATVGRVLLYCFKYDPAGKTYVFNTMKVFGVGTTATAILLFVYLVAGGRRRPRRRRNTG